MAIKAVQLREYFKEQQGFVRTTNSTEFLMENPALPGTASELSMTVPVSNEGQEDYMVEVVVEFESIEHFIGQTGIGSADELENITASFAWAQYLTGKGFVSCLFLAEEEDICFRIRNGMTIIYSIDLHYYDEIEGLLTMPAHFIEYMEERKERLGTYAALVMERGGFEKIG